MVTVPRRIRQKVAQQRTAVAPLKARCRKADVTHDAIAAHLAVTRPYVVNVFAGRKRATERFVVAVEALCERNERRAARKAS